MRKKKVR